jgi:hypothetical protein
MSDYSIRFIPEKINIILSLDELTEIEALNWAGNTLNVIVNNKILFADAGQNFETVNCPYCKSNLMECWGNAMNSAFSEEYGFIDLFKRKLAYDSCTLLVI